MRFGNCNLGGLKKLQEKLNKVKQADMDVFLNDCAKELAARLLRDVIRNTPVGRYDTPVSFTTKEGKTVAFTPKTKKTGGALRRGWTARTHEEAAQGSGSAKVAEFLENLTVTHTGDCYRIEIKNPMEYASYVEYGHRTADHKGWVPGKFMLTLSEKHIKGIAPQLLARKLKKFLEGYFS